MPPTRREEDLPALLAGHPMLRKVPTEALAQVQSAGERRRFTAGTAILREGELAEGYWLLCRGSVKVLYQAANGSEVVVKLFGAPAGFGEMELLTGQRHVETCVAVENSLLWFLPKPAFERLLNTVPVFLRQVLDDTCAKFYIAAQNERALAFMGLPERLAQLLLAYVRLYGVPVEGGMGLRVRLSQEDVARGLGASRRSVIRVFNDWQRDGILLRRGHRYIVPDLGRLAACAGPGATGVDWRAGQSLSGRFNAQQRVARTGGEG